MANDVLSQLEKLQPRSRRLWSWYPALPRGALYDHDGRGSGRHMRAIANDFCARPAADGGAISKVVKVRLELFEPAAHLMLAAIGLEIRCSGPASAAGGGSLRRACMATCAPLCTLDAESDSPASETYKKRAEAGLRAPPVYRATSQRASSIRLQHANEDPDAPWPGTCLLINPIPHGHSPPRTYLSGLTKTRYSDRTVRVTMNTSCRRKRSPPVRTTKATRQASSRSGILIDNAMDTVIA